MQLLPMASSPDGLISAWYAVITKTPGWGVLTTTSKGGGGVWGLKVCRTNNGPNHFYCRLRQSTLKTDK